MCLRSAMASLILLSGCSSYVNVKSQLADQASKAIDALEERAVERASMLDEISSRERDRLDAAFDLDVIQRNTLDASWVIEHRKAYAIGLDALNAERASRHEAVKIDQENAASAREALALLERIHNIESGRIFARKYP